MSEFGKKGLSKMHFDAEASTYDENLGTFASQLYPEIINWAEETEADRILDLGCGTGNILRALWERRPNAKYYGLDISPKMLAQARAKLRKPIYDKAIMLAEGDSEDLPLKDKSVDLVICNASFHHYPHPGNVLLEIKRVLKKKGYLIIGDPCPSWLSAPFVNRFKKHDSEHHIYTKREFKRILKAAGFKVKRFKKPQRRSCVILARKR